MLLLAGALAPGLWWRSGPGPANRTGAVEFRALAGDGSQRSTNGVTLAGTWALSSADPRFGGYSSLVRTADGSLRAYSDRGMWLEFAPPGSAARGVEFGSVRGPGGKFGNDIEAAVHDPASGTIWLALEFSNRIRRIAQEVIEAAPPAMARFRANGGAEAMVRLSDGRFVVLAESAEALSPMRRTGLLFATDPVIDARATAFVFEPPPGYDPVDAATLPDGRVLILLRALSLNPYPMLQSRLVVADPAEIHPGQPWPWREVARLSGLAPRENYEGLAVVPGESGLVLWLVSDANKSVWLQRTLLVKLVWSDWRAR